MVVQLFPGAQFRVVALAHDDPWLLPEDPME
jgi:hypothetical protein